MQSELRYAKHLALYLGHGFSPLSGQGFLFVHREELQAGTTANVEVRLLIDLCRGDEQRTIESS